MLVEISTIGKIFPPSFIDHFDIMYQGQGERLVFDMIDFHGQDPIRIFKRPFILLCTSLEIISCQLAAKCHSIREQEAAARPQLSVTHICMHSHGRTDDAEARLASERASAPQSQAYDPLRQTSHSGVLIQFLAEYSN